MSKTSSSRKDLLPGKTNDEFVVVIMSSYDKIEKNLLDIFPLSKKDSKHNYKYVSRYIFSIKESITLPKDFTTQSYPEIIDKLKQIDILILTYNVFDKLSFEYLKTFYYLYFVKLEEDDKPKNIIILERDYTPKDEISYEEKVDPTKAKNLRNLFNGHFYSYEDDLETINREFNECLKKLLIMYNYINDYSTFKYKELNKEINTYILIYGDKSSQNTFLDILLNSKCNFEYKKIKDNFYEIKYEKIINDNSFSFRIILKLVNNEYFYDSECNIFLYDINNPDSYTSIQNLIRGLINTNGSKFKKIYELFALNTKSDTVDQDEIDSKIKDGKNISYEIGANFSFMDTTNDSNLGEEMKIKIDKILEQVINNINMSKTITKEDTKEKPFLVISDNYVNKHQENEPNIASVEDSIPGFFLREVNNRITNELKLNQDCLFNICPECFSHLSIRINEPSNIIITYCDKCNSEPIGSSIDQFIESNKIKKGEYHCKSCKNTLNYNFKTNKLGCGCENDLVLENASTRSTRSYTTKNLIEFVPIPIYLKDCYCQKHNNFYQYYLKYSKESLCTTCFNKKKLNNFFVEKYISEDINELIKSKNEEIKKEKEFINNLQVKFNECINFLQLKFEKYIGLKIKKHMIKSDIIKSLQIIQNNNTLISNVKSLKFDFGDEFKYNENDTIENRMNYIYNYLNYDATINNIYLEKNKNYIKEPIHINDSIINLIQKKAETIATDIWGLKNNELICISYNNGKAKIFDLKKSKNKNIPICLIEEFGPTEGINSLYVSKNKNNFLKKKNNYNEKEIIYLNGYENIKIIQPNEDYSSYYKLYTIQDEMFNISKCIEIDDNNCLYLTMDNDLKLISFNNTDNNDEIKYDTKVVNNDLTEHKIISISKLKDNIISLNLSKNDNFHLAHIERNSMYTLYEPQKENETYSSAQNDENSLLKNYAKKDFNIDDLDNLEELDSFQTMENNDTICNEINEEENGKNINGVKEKNNSEKFLKLITIKINKEEKGNEITSEEGNETLFKEGDGIELNVIKEYKFNNNYEILGMLSEEKDLIMLKYTEDNKKENEYCIFDYNISQFLFYFKLHNTIIEPKILIKIDYNNIFDKQGFIILCKDFTIEQYFYDEDYNNKIYRINSINLSEIKNNLISEIFSFINNDIL